MPDTRYGVKNFPIWELKYIKEGENPEKKIAEAKEQMKRYEKDKKFIRFSKGTTVYKYILLAYKDRMEVLEVQERGIAAWRLCILGYRHDTRFEKSKTPLY